MLHGFVKINYKQARKREADLQEGGSEDSMNLLITLFCCVCSEAAGSALRASLAFTAQSC